jgi:sugar phosphate isomerase/epimerase
VHLKDFALIKPEDKGGIKSPSGKRYVGCEIGVGEAEVDACLGSIKRSPYRGWLSLEVGTRPPLASAIQAAKYVAEAWRRV